MSKDNPKGGFIGFILSLLISFIISAPLVWGLGNFGGLVSNSMFGTAIPEVTLEMSMYIGGAMAVCYAIFF